MSEQFDVVVVGAGTAGIPTAIEAAAAGARVLLVEKDHRIGGTLHTTGGHVVGAGTRRQREHGIEDTREAWLADIRRITPRRLPPGHHRPGRRARRPSSSTGSTTSASASTRHAADHLRPRAVLHAAHLLRRRRRRLAARRVQRRCSTSTSPPVASRSGPTPRCSACCRTDDDRRRHRRRSRCARGTDVEVHADAVVLATGGFGERRRAVRRARGLPAGVRRAPHRRPATASLLAQEAGAAFQGEGVYLPTFGGLPHPTTPGRVQWEERPLLTAGAPAVGDLRRPHRQRAGSPRTSRASTRRSARSSRAPTTSRSGRSATTARVDESVPMVVNWTPDDVRAKANVREGVTRPTPSTSSPRSPASTPTGCCATVARYNEMVARGVDDDFGRTYLPAPIEKPPFYAMRNHGVTLVTFVGVDVDGEMRARREDGIDHRRALRRRRGHRRRGHHRPVVLLRDDDHARRRPRPPARPPARRARRRAR